MIVEGEVGLAGRRLDADGVTGQSLALAALAKLRALGLVIAVQLYRRRGRFCLLVYAVYLFFFARESRA